MPARDCKYSRDSRGTALRSPVAAAAAALVVGAAAASAADLPAGFSWVTAADGFVEPVTIRFTPGGTMLIAEQCGAVYVVEEGVRQPQPLIDLTAEVNAQNDRGLLGLAVDPMFDENGYVYFLYTVDPVEGERDEPASDGSAGRLTRYTTIESKGALVADPATRFVLLGDPLDTGTPCCWKSHAVGAMHFATDGSLFVSTGDGALYSQADAGGLTPNCFLPPLFDQSEDIGAFRSQRLESLGGKILRIDPATGLGLPDNPFFTGDASDNRSRVFASGLRNPFRFSIRPGSPAPGTIYVGDVGWGTYEELNVVTGGENFGWPCLEGPIATPGYDQATPASNGCDTIETAENPGPLTSPLMHWHHWQSANSSPVGIVGRAPSSTTFYDGTTYPSMYQGALFQVDLLGNSAPGPSGWIRTVTVSDEDALVSTTEFATAQPRIVDLVPDPTTGDLHAVRIEEGTVLRLNYSSLVEADVNGDGVVDVNDLIAVITAWGPCEDCPADIDGSGAVDVGDLVIIVLNWS